MKARGTQGKDTEARGTQTPHVETHGTLAKDGSKSDVQALDEKAQGTRARGMKVELTQARNLKASTTVPQAFVALKRVREAESNPPGPEMEEPAGKGGLPQNHEGFCPPLPALRVMSRSAESCLSISPPVADTECPSISRRASGVYLRPP